MSADESLQRSGEAAGPLRLTVLRPVAVAMVFVSLVVFGVVSLTGLPLNLLPDISYPRVTVRAEYPGAAPEDVEERVTKRLHETLSVLPGLETISSVSRAELTDVTLEFVWGTNLSYAIQDIRERLDRSNLPLEVPTPIILRYDPTLDPIMVVGLTGGRDLIELRLLAEDRLAPMLSTVEGMAAVRVRGGLEDEIQVRLRPEKLAQFNLRPTDVIARLAAENVNMASGTVLEGDTEYLVRILNEYQTPTEIGRTTLPVGSGTEVRLEEVATIRRTPKERDVITRIDGEESVQLEIFKEADANIVDLAKRVRSRLFGTAEQRSYVRDLRDGVTPDPDDAYDAFLTRVEANPTERAALERIAKARAESSMFGGPDGGGAKNDAPEDNRTDEQKALDETLRAEEDKLLAEVAKKEAAFEYDAATLPSDVRVQLLSDQSRFIEDALGEVQSSAAIGAVLAVFVLYLFLRQLGTTLIIGVAIPVSVMVTFVPLRLTDTSLNVMSLGGLALGIGMVVDNAIVVLESIARCRERGLARGAAAVAGVREVAGAATASTLTTVAVFAPIVFVEGIAGQIFRDQALTVVASLIASLIVALFLVPMLAGLGRDGSSGFSVRSLLGSLRRVVFGPSLAFAALRGDIKRFGMPWVVLLFPFIVVARVLHFALEVAGRVLLALLALVVGAVALVAWLVAKIFVLVMWVPSKIFAGIFEALRRIYPPVIRGITRSPIASGLVLLIAGAMMVWTVQTAGKLGSELLPEVHQGEIISQLSMPVGTPLEATDALARTAEETLAGHPDVAWVSAVIGVPRDEIAEADEGEHTARLTIGLRSNLEDVVAAEESVMNTLRERLHRLPELRDVRFERPALFAMRSPIQVEIKGDDLAALALAAAAIEAELYSIPALRDIRTSIQPGSPEVMLTFDRDLLARMGLDSRTVATLVADSVKGNVATRFTDADQKLDVLVLTDKKRLTSIEDLMALPANPASAASEPLSSLSRSRVREGPREIRRIWGQRAAIVSASLSGFDIGSAGELIERRVQELMRTTDLNITLGGQGRQMKGALEQMSLALLLAVFLVYVVMASIFESLLQPLIILVTVPLALVGAIGALWLLDIPLSVVVFIGAIILAGIVVNNAIVLIDAINRRRRIDGMGLDEAVAVACELRLRPILMTTLTTVLGLLPLTGWLPFTGGEGTELRAPMAVTVVAGLSISTLLTLVVIPTVYTLVERMLERARDLRTDEAANAEAAG